MWATPILLLFTDSSYRELMTQIRENPSNKKSPEMGLTLASEWTPVARNLAASFESRLVLDLLSVPRGAQPFFFAAISGKQLGNFDVIYDLRSRQQIAIGQTTYRDNRTFFDIWTCFESRSFRSRVRAEPKPEFELA